MSGKLLSAISVLELTRVATSDVNAHCFVGCDGVMVADGGVVLGVSKTDAKPGDAYGVDVIGAIDMIAGAAIAIGQEVQSNASAQPVPKAAGSRAGIALTGAANPGDIVKVLLK